MTETTNDTAQPTTNSGCVLEYDDLRDWLAAVEAKGDLKTVTGANWHTDIGQVVEVMCHDEGTPSVLFDEVEGCPPGFRILISTGTRKNLTLGFPKTSTSWNSRVATAPYQNMKPVPTRSSTTGLCSKTCWKATTSTSQVSAPLWNPDDGGRHIGTGCFNTTRDPDTGWINRTYRVMIHDENASGFIPARQTRAHSP